MTGKSAASVAERLAAAVDEARALPPPAALRAAVESLLVDVAGLCVAARRTDYIRAALDAWEANGGSTAIGHARTLDAAGAAFVNGTAAHGEDFDDTFEGGPVHAGAVVVPAVLAIAERHRIAGPDALFGLAVGTERLCRRGLRPRKPRRAEAHPQGRLPSHRGARRDGRGGGGRRGAPRAARGVRERTRDRRIDGERDHRIPRRGGVDEAPASGLGGAVGHPRGRA